MSLACGDRKVVVSVIITMYQSGSLIREALDSVLAQTFLDYEIVLVDNNASDETLKWAIDYREKFPLIIRIVQEKRQGRSVARNKGILESKGTYIALLDDDDLMTKDRLSRQLFAMESNPNCSIVHSLVACIPYSNPENVLYIQSVGHEFYNKFLYFHVEEYLNSPETSPISIPMTASSMFFKKQTAIDAGLFDELLDPQGPEDHEFALRMFDYGPYLLLKEPVVLYRLPDPIYAQNKRKGISWINTVRSHERLYEIFVNKFGGLKKTKIDLGLRQLKSVWIRECSVEFLRYRGGRSVARKLLLRSLSVYKWDMKTYKSLIRTYFPKFFLERKYGMVIETSDFPHEITEDFIASLYMSKK